MKNKQGMKRSAPPESSANARSTRSSAMRAHRSSATDDQGPVSVLRPQQKITSRLLLPRHKAVSPAAHRSVTSHALIDSTVPTTCTNTASPRLRGRKRNASGEWALQEGRGRSDQIADRASKREKLGRQSPDSENINEAHTQQASQQLPQPTTTTARRRATSPAQDTSVERPRNIQSIVYGRYKIDTWYYSPYPSEFGSTVDELFICEHCLKYTPQDDELRAHKLHCKRRKPPGRVIYQKDKVRVYEVDGRDHKLYCQNLCLMSKLFLETKTLYYDVEGFTFYVLTEQDRSMDLFVGYFSKEKISYDNYNLACIMILPPQQRNGYGRLLIELSYELSKREGTIGSPEKPLSTLGALGYRSYWASTLMCVLREFEGQMTVKDLSNRTGIHPDDVISTLTWLDLLTYWETAAPPEPSENGEPHAEPSSVVAIRVCIKTDMIENAIKQHRIRLTKMLDPDLIQWLQ